MELVSKKTGTPLTKERHIQYQKIFNYLKEKGIETLEDADFYLKPLDYYYRLPLRLGSLSVLSTTHICKTHHDRVHSIYFVVLGEDYYTKAI